jgi:hypothetical protein
MADILVGAANNDTNDYGDATRDVDSDFLTTNASMPSILGMEAHGRHRRRHLKHCKPLGTELCVTNGWNFWSSRAVESGAGTRIAEGSCFDIFVSSLNSGMVALTNEPTTAGIPALPSDDMMI